MHDMEMVLHTINYIEDHLKEKLSVDQISDVAGFSKYHFTRLFSKMTGLSPYDYYRGRKVTEAIHYMEEKSCKIIEAAYEFGFGSPEVFGRACSAVFGKVPSAIRKEVEAGVFTGVKRMDEAYLWFVSSYNRKPVLKFMSDLELLGIGYFSENPFETLRHMTREQLAGLDTDNPKEIYKVSWLNKGPKGYMNFIGKQSWGEAQSESHLIKKIPKMAYLLFDMIEDVGQIDYFMSYIYNHYLPASPYKEALPYHLEVMSVEGQVRNSRLFIPVVPRS
ncbi:helix-turn-helix domain-containing protein [Petrocella sp. FN5]|uniref:helix-turn-helix domain-containing protein n=1 Tax=Petrocella sp. FN5 TaxID=3032002 RepID=UPI0023DC606B|nr:AraC family transcriptional regulator [Petrocella sp. FN5]MDF1617994.1 AraC family transcriptional regulator [Petrocella sp. FN5]